MAINKAPNPTSPLQDTADFDEERCWQNAYQVRGFKLQDYKIK